MSNYPPGMSASQIPGFDAVDVPIDAECDACDWKGTLDATAEHGEIVWLCPACDHEHRFENGED